MKSSLHEAIRERRLALGLSQAEAARRSGIQQRQVSTFERGGDVTLSTLLKLAQALVHDPELLILDEPTNGLDPRGRQEMLDLVRDLRQNKGIHVVLSSHLSPGQRPGYKRFTSFQIALKGQNKRLIYFKLDLQTI